MAVALTEPAVRAALKRAEAENVRVEVVDATTLLRLRVTPAGVGSWVLACATAWARCAASHWALGPTWNRGRPEGRPSHARRRRRGADPIAAKRSARVEARAEAERDRLTLEVLVDDWTRKHLAKRSDGYRTEACVR